MAIQTFSSYGIFKYPRIPDTVCKQGGSAGEEAGLFWEAAARETSRRAKKGLRFKKKIKGKIATVPPGASARA